MAKNVECRVCLNYHPPLDVVDGVCKFCREAQSVVDGRSKTYQEQTVKFSLKDTDIRLKVDGLMAGEGRNLDFSLTFRTEPWPKELVEMLIGRLGEELGEVALGRLNKLSVLAMLRDISS